MIKKLIFALLAIVMLQQAIYAQDKTDQRTTTTRIADLLAQLPARDAKQLNRNMQEIADLGEDGYVGLIGGLAPGAKGNAVIEYAVSGFSAYVSKAGQESLRKMSAAAYCKALAKLTDNPNKAFVISQFELVGNDAAVSCIAPYLKDEVLADPAARALAKINTENATAALLAALPATSGKAQLAIVDALGHSHSKQAAEAIKKLFAGKMSGDVAKVCLYALANIADPASKEVLANSASSVGFKPENTNAVDAYLVYANKLLLTDKVLATSIAKEILEKAKGDDLVHTRTAALKIVAATEPDYLLAALNDPDFKYRAAALKFATANLIAGKGTADAWIGKLGKADAETQVAIIQMLAQAKVQAALPAVTKLINSKDQSVKLAAIEATGSIGQEAALAALLKSMTKADTSTLSAYSNALLRIKGDGVTTQVAAFIPKAKPDAQVALINVLAARAAHNELPAIYSLLKNKNPEVKNAAYRALSTTVNAQDLPQLFVLLNETSDQTELVSVQDAVISAVKGGKEEQVDVILKQMDAATAEKKPLYYKILGSLGGKKALAAVSAAFSTGGDADKQAALLALSSWNDSGSADELIKIARTTTNAEYLNQALKGYLRLINTSGAAPEQKLLMLRNAMAVAKTTAQQQEILKSADQAKAFNTLIFAGKYLDDAGLQQAAATTVMNVVMAGKYNGIIVKDLINKTIQVLKGADAEYQKEGLRKYLAEMKEGEGFVSMFNGTDLTGWKGLVADPIKRAKMDAATLATEQAKADAEMKESWKVVNGELQFQSHGNNLATLKKYGDFEMLVDWKIIDDKKGEGDAGIYLRGTPQVQIWDNARVKVGAQVGSGGLYNNRVNPSKPLVVADNKLDEWNTFRILMHGDRVTVYLNGQLVTDNVVLENYWDKNLPIFAEEQIELQAHGSPVAYRDIFIREIPRPKPFELSAQEKKEGYKVLFDGTNMHSWTGNTTDYIIEDGNIAIRPKPGKGSGGNLFTKDEYSDFVYRFEFKLTPGANNGLGIRAPFEGDAAYEGMELQILDNEAPIYKDLHVYQYHGSIYGTIPAKRGFLKPVGEWNYEEVVVNGPKIKVVLNGTVILDADITDARKNGAADHKPHPGLLRDSGHIGFLGHGSPVEFRNIRIKELNNKVTK
ncbi:DUF1080 domain-containing protein [Pedobacter sp. HDW13]|uniref:family 16 glycoside hydrolase n=1 Tax=Pedobacter sp. HDW13 TaxID=2714940 RepID=UPI00140D9831|nr:family 16 glycoside hydrolase [Pedobacter sp. HDW13]QIL40205.1 DUF1080 domain-containing protein [Pedobacter sp. HDW13]